MLKLCSFIRRKNKIQPATENVVKETESYGIRTEHTCFCIAALVGLSLLAALIAVILTKESPIEKTILRKVYVVISHGERTPNHVELDTLGDTPERHTFAPYGVEALTNEGKLLTYEMGLLLRRRYNEFLGDVYEPEQSLILTSDTELTKMTGLLLAAGLWPPTALQKWNNSLQWQPVPYTYPKKENDYMLYEQNCERYKQERKRLLDELIDDGGLVPYKDLFNRISLLTDTNFTSPTDAFNMFNLFLIQEDLKVANPKWAKHVKRKLGDIARIEFHMMYHNTILKKLSGGALLNAIIKWSGVETGDITKGSKLVVQTCRVRDVSALLSATVAAPPRLPDPGVAMVFELHERKPTRENPVKYGFKIYYWDDDSAEPKLMEVPGCQTFCPYEQFVEITKDVVSKDYKQDCQPVNL